MASTKIDWSQAKPYIPGSVFLETPVNAKDQGPSVISLSAGAEEMLRITEQGFWVRGVEVPQDEKEAKLVYEAFREWMTWASLTRKY